MKKFGLFLFISLSASLCFAAAKPCEFLFNTAYENYRHAVMAEDEELKREAVSIIAREHKRMAVEHNLKVTTSGEGYYVYPMVRNYIGEHLVEPSDVGPVRHFNEMKLHNTKVSFDDQGRLYQEDKLLSTGNPEALRYEEWDFVMFGNGDIHIFAGHPGEVHHSSPSHGQPIAAAGTISVIEGVVQFITTKTNHYADPTALFVLQFVSELRRRGVRVRDVGLDFQKGDLLPTYAMNASDQFGIPIEFFDAILTN